MAIQQVVLLVAGIATLALAGFIAIVGIGRGLHRALALLVAARGMALLLPQLSSDPQWAMTAVLLQPYFTLAVAPLALYCVATLGRQAAGPMWGWGTLLAVVAIDGLYALDHALAYTLEPGIAATGALQAAAGVKYASFGPLMLVAGLAAPMLGLLGMRAAIHYRENAYEPQAMVVLLLAAGLLAGSLFEGANRLVAVVNLLDEQATFPWTPWGWAVMGLPLLGLVPALLGTALLASNRAMDPRPLHGLEGSVLALLAVAFFTGFVRLVAPADSDIGGHPMVLVLLGAWRLVMPVTLAYAMLHDAWTSAAVPERAPAPAEA